MTPEAIPISATTRTLLSELSVRTGRSTTELVAEAVEEYRRPHLPNPSQPIESVAGIMPEEVWEAAAEADAGKLTAHDAVFSQLRQRP